MTSQRHPSLSTQRLSTIGSVSTRKSEKPQAVLSRIPHAFSHDHPNQFLSLPYL